MSKGKLGSKSENDHVLFKFINKEKHEDIRHYMQEIDDPTKIRRLENHQGYSLFQMAARRCSRKSLEIFIEFIMDSKSKVQKSESRKSRYIQEMINTLSNSKEGFNALHFAAFRGELEIIRLFESYGADHTVKSR